MKKIILSLLLIQGGFLMAQQKETVATINGKKIQIDPNATAVTAGNGLTAASGNVELGGALLKATTLTTTSSATLALQGLQTGATADKILVADANGVLKWIDRATLAGDNLGNHTATTTLNMAKNTINNVNVEYFADQIAANTNTYGIYKNTGVLGFYNGLKSGNDLTIDEATRKTGVNNLSISAGTDGSVPVAGSIATSLDANGNVVWKSAASVVSANQVQSDWNMDTTTDPAYIKNKPSISSSEPWFTGSDVAATSATNTATGQTYFKGWVGIGGFTTPSAAPNEKLRVNGAITTVNSYYADYVFEDYFKGFSDIKADYKFKTLADVDAFIKENKHLPGITSINELQKTDQGYMFNVSELSVQLLEKTEELYLHVIEQQKELDAKNNEIKSLNERLEKLEKIVLDKK